MARSAWKGPGAGTHGVPGLTRIIQGAPGASKSSILAELAARSLRAAETNSPAPRVLVLSSEMLEESIPHALNLLHEIGRAEQRDWVKRGRILFGRATDHVDPVSLGDIGLDLSGQTLGGLLALRDAVLPERWARPVIVAIDEAQNMPPDTNTPLRRVLRGLHGASPGLPLTLVLAGLGDTPDRASEIGLTRGSRIHDIGALAPDEVTAFMQDSCQHFGMDSRDHRQNLHDLAFPCEGWPRHLHFALQALGEDALKVEGDLAGVNWESVKGRAEKSRLHYYRDQQSREMTGSSALVAAALSDLRPGDRKADVINSIAQRVRQAGDVRWQLPEGMTVHTFADHLIHQGAVQETSDRIGPSPAPSPHSRRIPFGRAE